MSFFCDSYPIVDKKALGEGIYSYTLKCPEVAENAHIVFEVRGKGTDKISELNKGDLMDVIAPLGNGFTVPAKKDGRVIVVGGGIGTPPLLDIAKMYGDRCTAILGFRSFDKVILDKDYSLAGANVTDDGSTGVHGTIAQPLADELAKGDVAAVYACGPTPMLKAVVAAAKQAGVYSEVSLEQRMGCGVGACVVCACTVIRDGEEKVLRVCKDGPVFSGEEVVL